MSLISIGPISYRIHTYTLVDSELGRIEIREENLVGALAAAKIIVETYSKHNLPIGRNLALAMLYYRKKYNWSIKESTKWHDEYCPAHIPNWKQYAAERDYELEKLIPLL